MLGAQSVRSQLHPYYSAGSRFTRFHSAPYIRRRIVLPSKVTLRIKYVQHGDGINYSRCSLRPMVSRVISATRLKPSRAGDLEDILGSLPEHAFDSQAWEEYRPRAAAASVQPGAASAVPTVRQTRSRMCCTQTIYCPPCCCGCPISGVELTFNADPNPSPAANLTPIRTLMYRKWTGPVLRAAGRRGRMQSCPRLTALMIGRCGQ